MKIWRSCALVALLFQAAAAIPWLGLSIQSLALDSGRIALEIKGVHPESGARVAGLQPGDRIISFDNTLLTNLDMVKRRLGISHSGQVVRLGIERGKKRLVVPVKLTERPDDASVLTGSLLGSRAPQLTKNFYANADAVKKQPLATVVDFWATWCRPCRQTQTVLADLYERLGSNGLEIIGVSTEAAGVLKDYQQYRPSRYPMFRDADQSQSRRYGIQAVPTLLLLDHQGYIQKIYQGVPDPRQLEHDIRKVMGSAPAPRGAP